MSGPWNFFQGFLFCNGRQSVSKNKNQLQDTQCCFMPAANISWYSGKNLTYPGNYENFHQKRLRRVGKILTKKNPEEETRN